MTQPSKLRAGFLFIVYFLCAAALQWRSGAFQSEFSADPDEPAHYVTGLMVRDYIASGFPAYPIQYARNYYLHYPKVAIGHWPPVFYMLQAAWTLVFSPSRVSVLLLMAALAAASAALTYTALRKEFPESVSIIAGLVLLSLPAFQEFSHDIMTEMLLTLLVLLAVLAFGSWLDTGRWQAAAWFAVWSATAVLAKGSAVLLAFVPPFAALLTRRWFLLRRLFFWFPAVVVIGIAGPWYLFVPGAQHESVARYGDLTFDYPRLVQSFLNWEVFLGVVPSVLALVGLAVLISRIRRSDTSGRWIATLSALLGAYVGRVLVGAFESRHLIATVPLLIMLAVLGGAWVVRRWPRTAAPLVIGVATAGLLAFNVWRTPIKVHSGYAETAQALLTEPRFRNSVLLVCAYPTGEGMLISEIAMREARPGHIVLRGSKMLASSNWMGREYHLLFDHPEEQLRYLETLPVGVVVIDGDGRKTPHGRLLYRGILSHPEKWEPVNLPETANRGRQPEDRILVFQLRGHEGRPVGKIRIPTSAGLIGDIEN